MRLKTLGVIVVTALALFTVFYWLTDAPRRAAAETSQEEELLAYAKEVFGPPSAEVPATANCAQCHGADGTGGQVGSSGIQAPNLHSARLAQKLKANPNYVNLVIRFGGVVVSGNVNSPMPAWSTEVGGPLTVQQIDALTALVTSWAAEGAQQSQEPVPNTVEAGQQVYVAQGCGGCHGADLAGVEGTFPNLQNIGNELVTDLPTPVSGLDQMKADYAADPKTFLDKWIRDSWGNYNGGQTTGMPQHPEDTLPQDQLDALITFLLDQKQ